MNGPEIDGTLPGQEIEEESSEEEIRREADSDLHASESSSIKGLSYVSDAAQREESLRGWLYPHCRSWLWPARGLSFTGDLDGIQSSSSE